MKLEDMRQRKRELGYTNAMIASLSGLPQGTVDKVLSGATASPRRDTILALEKVLAERSSTGTASNNYYSSAWADYSPAPDMVREEAFAYGSGKPPFRRQGTYTIDDYMALPDERRVELIDGVFYDMASPADVHQLILGRLYYVLLPCVDAHPACELFLSPSDVPLGNDRRTMVQPDLYIRCKTKEEVEGDAHPSKDRAPDFVIEIVSPSNRRHDMVRKLNKYMDTGVREYWIVDPYRQTVYVYDFTQEELNRTYTFDDTIPVRISDGECQVDFSYIREKVKAYLD